MESLRERLIRYKQEKRAMVAFNIDCLEIYQAVEEVVVETKMPCMVQLSPGEDEFVKAERLLMLVKKARLEGLPIYTNMDHGKDIRRLEFLVRLGFDMVHFDGSTADYESNINLSQYFVNKIRAINPEILVEVEFNKIKAVGEAIDPESLTKVEEAKDFMNRSGAEMLAVSIGNLHGVNINSPERLDLELLKKIAGVLPDKFLAMHGGSGIDQVQLKEAIKMGIVKINVNTDLRLAFRKGMIKGLAENKGDKVYEWMMGAVEEVKRVVRERLLNGASR